MSCLGTVQHGKHKGADCSDAWPLQNHDRTWCGAVGGCVLKKLDAKEEAEALRLVRPEDRVALGLLEHPDDVLEAADKRTRVPTRVPAAQDAGAGETTPPRPPPCLSCFFLTSCISIPADSLRVFFRRGRGR